MRRRLWAVAALCGIFFPSFALGQTTNRERARDVLAPDVLQAVEALAEAAGRDGLPVDPVYAKALEGVAKGVPAARLLPALDLFAGRLRAAGDILGATAGAPLLVAGVDALARGVPTETLRSLSVEERRPVAVVVLGDLVQSGVPADAALEVVREALARRAPDEALLDIPPAARRLLRDAGSTDAALDALRRRIREGGGRVGPPAPPGSEPIDRDRRRGGGG